MSAYPDIVAGIYTQDKAVQCCLRELSEAFAQESGRVIHAESVRCPEPGTYDLLFWDLSGSGSMARLRQLRERDHCAVLILLAEDASYALQGYGLGAKGYLFKPVQKTSFGCSLRRAVLELKRQQPRWMTFADENGTLRLSADEIRAALFQPEGVRLLLAGESRLLRSPSELFFRQAEGQAFLRCGPDTLVNSAWVSRIHGREITVGEYTLPIAGNQTLRFRADMRQCFSGNILRQC